MKTMCRAPIFFALGCLMMTGCDLHPRIVGAFGGEGAGAHNAPASNSPPVAENAEKSEHGTRIDTMYGQGDNADLYGHAEPEYASVSDYYAPADDTLPESRGIKETSAVATAAVDSQHDDDSIVITENTTEDVLLVPARTQRADEKPTIVAPSKSEIIVQKGDTLYSIAKNNNVPLRDLADYNKLTPPYSLSIGQKLQLPGARVHTVIAGDTLYSISRRYSVDLHSLAGFNDLKAPYSLAVGQQLRLPATIAQTGATITSASSVAPPQAASAPTVPTVAPPKTPAATYGAITPAPTASTAKTPAAATKTTAATAQTITETKKIGTAGDVKKLPAATKMTSTKFSWPVRGKIISGFGAKSNGLYNDGINIATASGTTVKAAENGVVAYAGNELKGMGNLVIIQHSGGWMTVYAHMDTLSVKRGAKVGLGEKIGTVGRTGKVSEPQLHFEIRKGTKAYNPTAQMKK